MDCDHHSARWQHCCKLQLISEKEHENGPVRTKEEHQKLAYKKIFAIALVTGTDPSKFGTLIAHLLNQYAMGKDEYPSIKTAAFNLLVNYCTPENATQPRPQNHLFVPVTMCSAMSSGIIFVQDDKLVAGIRGGIFPNIDCCHCGSFGHDAVDCPALATPSVGTNLTHYAFMMAETNTSHIDPKWILLDSQSTISIFNNFSILTNIHKSNHTLRALTNNGHQDSHLVGEFGNLSADVWNNPNSIANSIANILSLVLATWY